MTRDGMRLSTPPFSALETTWPIRVFRSFRLALWALFGSTKIPQLRPVFGLRRNSCQLRIRLLVSGGRSWSSCEASTHSASKPTMMASSSERVSDLACLPRRLIRISSICWILSAWSGAQKLAQWGLDGAQQSLGLLGPVFLGLRLGAYWLQDGPDDGDRKPILVLQPDLDLHPSAYEKFRNSL